MEPPACTMEVAGSSPTKTLNMLVYRYLQVCGIELSDNVIDVIYYVFDANHDGSLSAEEFLRVLQRREGDATLPREKGIMGLITCWLSCTKSCESAKTFL